MVIRWREDSCPGDPVTNMAVDSGLLEELIRDPQALPIVRLYTWDRPSVSIGRLQDDEIAGGAFPGLPIVRRPTGGHAVLHGGDLTVTVVIREEELPVPQSQGVLSSYRQIAGGLSSAFRALGILTHFGGASADRAGRNVVECFAAAASCDLVEGGTFRKLAGCAQRRQNGVILQQASIPLAGMPDATAITLAIRAGMQEALSVERWVSVDTVCPV